MTETDSPKRRRGRPSKNSSGSDKDQKQEILAAAEKEFSEKGFDGASVSSIAKRAATAQPLINYYFESKAQLWEAVIENIYEALQLALANPLEDEKDKLSVFQDLIRNFVLFSASRPSVALIIASELRAPGPRLQFLGKNYISGLERSIMQLVSQAFGISPRDKRLKLLFPMILSTCAGPFLHQSYVTEQHKLDPTAPRQAKLYADMAVELLTSGLKTLSGE
ncbi:TetR/AcrR family transcriptional regulator [Parvibaculum sp. MBR-TMA-1.3b-4.2]|jgi:AcrR family transcriptional regulator